MLNIVYALYAYSFIEVSHVHWIWLICQENLISNQVAKSCLQLVYLSFPKFITECKNILFIVKSSTDLYIGRTHQICRFIYTLLYFWPCRRSNTWDGRQFTTYEFPVDRHHRYGAYLLSMKVIYSKLESIKNGEILKKELYFDKNENF